MMGDWEDRPNYANVVGVTNDEPEAKKKAAKVDEPAEDAKG